MTIPNQTSTVDQQAAVAVRIGVAVTTSPESPRKVLVMGASGFVGSPMTRRAVARGDDDVRVYLRKSSSTITIVGESAGARAVATLLAVPAAAGRFHRAISESPPSGVIRSSAWSTAESPKSGIVATSKGFGSD